MIDNTSTDSAQEAFLLQSMATGDPASAVEALEARGQQQLVTSDRMPADLRGDRAAWTGLGFTFGEPDPADPLFMPATLPDAWTRQPSDHSMWSHIVDQHGRRRARVFYKAAFYDRRANATLITVYSYVWDCVTRGEQIVLDPDWATDAAVAAAIDRVLLDIDDRIALYSPGQPTASARDLDVATAERRHVQDAAEHVRDIGSIRTRPLQGCPAHTPDSAQDTLPDTTAGT